MESSVVTAQPREMDEADSSSPSCFGAGNGRCKHNAGTTAVNPKAQPPQPTPEDCSASSKKKKARPGESGRQRSFFGSTDATRLRGVAPFLRDGWTFVAEISMDGRSADDGGPPQTSERTGRRSAGPGVPSLECKLQRLPGIEGTHRMVTNPISRVKKRSCPQLTPRTRRDTLTEQFYFGNLVRSLVPTVVGARTGPERSRRRVPRTTRPSTQVGGSRLPSSALSGRRKDKSFG